MKWTTLEVLNWTTKKFEDEGIDSARLDAQLMLAKAMGCTRIHLYTQFDKPLGEEERATYRQMIKRRLDGEPVAYILGRKEFWSLNLHITPDVLVPRGDSEILVRVAMERADNPTSVVDVCTGSGAIALAIKSELPDASVSASELSPAAATVARKNSEALNLAVTIAEGDLLAPFKDQTFDVVVSNPPYIASAEMVQLPKDVKREPALALDGGASGLEVIERLVGDAKSCLAPGGLLAIEHGWEQGEQVSALLKSHGYREVVVTKDLAGRDRVTSGLA